MGIFGIVIGLVQGLVVVGLLALLQWIMSEVSPGSELPFSIWWGMIMSLPGLAWAYFAKRSGF